MSIFLGCLQGGGLKKIKKMMPGDALLMRE
jgi:hypothetical protein